MPSNNAFFQRDDYHVTEMDGFVLPDGWWSRGYEYPWVLQYAQPWQVVADMGTCYLYRPLRYELAKVCGHVYAVDYRSELLGQRPAERLEFVVANFTRGVDAIPSGSLDRIFCVSVLEEQWDIAKLALIEFQRLLKPDGLAVITMDARYLDDRPLLVYPGVDMDAFIQNVTAAGLEFIGPVDLDKTNALHHEEWNLAVFHCVLQKARNE